MPSDALKKAKGALGKLSAVSAVRSGSKEATSKGSKVSRSKDTSTKTGGATKTGGKATAGALSPLSPKSGRKEKDGEEKKKKAEKEAGPAEDTVLWKYLQEDDVYAVEELMMSGGDADVNIRDTTFGWTPGLFAANSGHSHMMKVLIDAKAKLEMVCNELNTPLMIAARRNNKKACEFLVSTKKVELNAQNSNGFTALIWSCMNGHEETAMTLIASNADYCLQDNEGRTACMWAARHGYLGIVEALLACGLNLDQIDEEGRSVMDHAQEHMEMRSVMCSMNEENKRMLKAAKRNDYQGVRLAIEAGCYLDLRDSDGWTALMYAALHNNLDLVLLVVRHGANPSLLDRHGQLVEELSQKNLAVGEALYTVLGSNERLLKAAKDQDWDAVDLELSIGAWVNVRDASDKRSALMWGGRHGSAYACGSLCGKGCAIDDRDSFGWAACHFAVSDGHLETVSMLHYQGANFGMKTYQGDTCLHIAVRANNGAMMQMLVCGKADIEATDVENLTSMQIAAKNGLPIAMRTLLAYSADVNAKDKNGRTPFHLAVINGHESICEIMMEPLKPPPQFPAEGELHWGKEAKAKGKAKPADKKEKVEAEKIDEPVAEPASPISRNVTGAEPEAVSRKVTEAEAKVPSEGGPSPRSPKLKEGKAKTKGKNSRQGSAARPGSADPGEPTKKKEAAFKKEQSKVGDNPSYLLDLATKKREALAKSDKNPLGPKAALKQADGHSKSSLALAVKYVQPEIQALLIKEKADVEAQDDKGITVLMEAVMTKQRDLVGNLLSMKCKADRKNKDGETATDLCKDAAIRMMLESFALELKLQSMEPKDGEDSKPTKALKKKKKDDDRPVWTVRCEQLPTNYLDDVLEEQVGALLKRCGAPTPVRIEVIVDPITGKPRGWAICEYYDAAACDVALRATGDSVFGQVIKVVRDSIPKIKPQALN